MNKSNNIKRDNGIIENVLPIESLAQFLEYISIYQEKRKDPVVAWYRGHSSEKFKLIPSTYRKEIWKFDFQKEYDVLTEFKRKSQKSLASDFEYYQLMQHYGFPTRLLDWSESPLIALLFALQSATSDSNPVVWMIDTLRFNEILSKECVTYYTFGENISPKVKQYLPKEYDSLLNEPIAVLPSYTDSRIISQKSCFVLFGKDQVPLEEIYYKKYKTGISSYPIAKLVIDKNKIDEIKRDLSIAGISYYTIYPDLEGLIKDLKSFIGMK